MCLLACCLLEEACSSALLPLQSSASPFSLVPEGVAVEEAGLPLRMAVQAMLTPMAPVAHICTEAIDDASALLHNTQTVQLPGCTVLIRKLH